MSIDLTLVIGFTLIGGLLVLIGTVLFIRARIFLSNAQEVKGTVIEMVYCRSLKGGSGTYAPVYQFKSLEGQNFVIQDGLSSNPPRFQVGQEIGILYNPGNPQEARINKWMNLYFVSVLLGCIGLIFAGVGIAIMFPQVHKMLGY